MSESFARILNIVGQFKKLIQLWDELHKAGNLIAESREEANAISLEMDKLKEKVLIIGEKLLNEQRVRPSAIEFRQEIMQRSFVEKMTGLLREIDECKHLYLQLRTRIGLIKFKIGAKHVTLNEISAELEDTTNANIRETLKYLKELFFNWSDINLLKKLSWAIFEVIFGLPFLVLSVVSTIFSNYLTEMRIKEIAVEFAKLEKLDLLLNDAYVEIESLQSLFDELYNRPNEYRSEDFYDNIVNRMIAFHNGYQLSVIST